MGKTVYKIFIILVLLISSMSLVSCKAIEAQKITNTGDMSGIGGNPGMNGGPHMNGNTRGNENFTNANLTGKIVSVDGNSIKIQLAEQANNNSNNKQSQTVFPGHMLEKNYTGATKTVTVTDDFKISQGQNMRGQNKTGNSKSSVKVSDLKAGQIIMIWYKQNTETVERISIVQS